MDAALAGIVTPPAPILTRRKALGLARTVETPGFLPENEKAERIRCSRFAVIPHNTGVDFCLVAIEARHLGLPCLLTSDGDVIETAGYHSFSSRSCGCPHQLAPTGGGDASRRRLPPSGAGSPCQPGGRAGLASVQWRGLSGHAPVFKPFRLTRTYFLLPYV